MREPQETCLVGSVTGSRHPLRIGVMLDSLRTTAWVAKILRDIPQSEFATLDLVILNDAARPALRPSLPQRLRNYWIHGLYNRYSRWDYNRYRMKPDAFETVDVADLVAKTEIIRTKPIQKGFVDRFAEFDIARFRQAGLDVVFRFGFRIIRGDILSCARYGVWSFHHGDNREYRGAPPGFWEMYEGNPVTGTILQILTDDLDGGHVIYRSFAATHPKSLYLNRNAAYWKTAEFALRRLRTLHQDGWEYIKSLPDYQEPNSYTKGIYKTPRAPAMLKFLARGALSHLRHRAGATLFSNRTQWFIALRRRQGSRTILDDTRDFRVLPKPKGRFYADPFLFKKDGRNYLFFENYSFAERKAVISCMELDTDGRCGTAETVLERDYHLSYPFLFEWDGNVYLLPEAKLSGRIELYRAEEFPRCWTLEKVLVDNVTAVDPTLFQYNGKFWLFANLATPAGNTHDELHLFYADSLSGEWTPHPKNPVVSDVRAARPGGALFRERGHLLRPAQDCALRYGHALVLNRIEELSESEYRETPYARIGPEWQPGNLCTHTYSRTEDFEVADGMFLERELRWPSRNGVES
jgi:hypothetical protein